MTTDDARRAHVFRCVLLLVAVYVALRMLNITGANASVRFNEPLLYAGAIVLFAWGVLRVLRRT